MDAQRWQPGRGGGATVHTTLWFDGGALQGTVTCDLMPGYNTSRPIHEVSTGPLTTVMRMPGPAASFQGTWHGRYVVQTCELIGWDFCYGDDVGGAPTMELTLSQSGSRVTGTFVPDYSPSQQPGYRYPIEVSGTVAGGTLQLTGVSAPYPNNPDVTRRLLTLSATRDTVGRLSGTLTWQDDFVGSGSANFGQLFRTTRSGTMYIVIQIK